MNLSKVVILDALVLNIPLKLAGIVTKYVTLHPKVSAINGVKIKPEAFLLAFLYSQIKSGRINQIQPVQLDLFNI